MNGEVRWTDEDGYVGKTSKGKVFGIYGDSSPSPMEMVLHSHAACSLIDVIDGLKGRSDNVEHATVEIHSQGRCSREAGSKADRAEPCEVL